MMTSLDLLKRRNQTFADGFAQADLPPLPKLGTMILTCIDARVDPAHVLGLELGDAVVFRNNGGRVTAAFLDEVTALAAMVAKRTGQPYAAFSIVLMQHTECGARAFADPLFQTELRDRFGVDVSANAIGNQTQDIADDIEKLKDAPHLPGTISVAAVLYDVSSGTIREIAPFAKLADLRQSEEASQS